MWRTNTPRVLDRAPVLFGSRRYLSHVCAQTVCVGAIPAVEPFQQIEIPKPSSIKNDIVFALDSGNSIDRKADSLIEPQKKIE
jgi:hypothetical protein